MTPESRWLTTDIGMIDLQFLGVPRVIASYVLRTSDGLAVIDPGPTTVIETLSSGIRSLGLDPLDIRHILATHIHLDHVGSAGSWLKQIPEAQFYVHERGAPHMIDPDILIRSATRIYGDDMERLWGDFLPVPEERTRVLSGGDHLNIGNRELQVVYTPGHASHHVAFHEPAVGTTFVGDVAGVRIPPSHVPIPPTPPPDVNVDAWKASIRTLQSLDPALMLLAHFGPVDDASRHLADLETNLDVLVDLVDQAIADDAERDAIVDRVAARIQGMMTAHGEPDVETELSLNVPYAMATDGLLRFVRKRNEARE